ncbi:hypothetical protein DFP72DRAFT_814162, partial [Ephemerocybe angulata]
VFNEQPNREFVRCVAISEKHALLVHFDRVGAQIFPIIDIHQDPFSFLRILFAQTSFDEETLGLDPGIRWEVRDGRKIGGTIDITDGLNGEVRAYRMAGGTDPVFTQSEIVGRGTRCWCVDGEGGEQLLIKDSWMPSTAAVEEANLEAALGVPGVVQVVDIDRPRTPITTELFRGACEAVRGGKDPFRIKSRVVMEAYGNLVIYSESSRQMVAAFRDAISGHRELLETTGLLHRDVSPGNVVLGHDNTRPGYRGVLIDLDLACSQEKLVNGATNHGGTTSHQSISVLRGRRDSVLAKRQIRDHLDDLESFFYVLHDTMFCWERCQGMCRKWVQEEDPLTAAEAKLEFWEHGFSLEGVDTFWDAASQGLLESFYHFVQEIVFVKEEINEHYAAFPEEDRRKRLALLGDRDSHYDEVLSFFDKALNEIDREIEIGMSRKRSL